ncbi:molybdopterin-dependent oxidoreductase [Shigella flexneri]
MVSYAAGTRYLLLGGACLSFYDWYCDLPPASPITWASETDVPESADWYNSSYIIAWGSNVPQTRTPDAHFFTEVRYKGTKTVAIARTSRRWRSSATSGWLPNRVPTTPCAMAMGHVILRRVSTLITRAAPTVAIAAPTCRCWSCWILAGRRSRGAGTCCTRRIWPTGWAKRIIRSGEPSP